MLTVRPIGTITMDVLLPQLMYSCVGPWVQGTIPVDRVDYVKK